MDLSAAAQPEVDHLDLAALLDAAVAIGVPAAELTPEVVLGLPREEVARLRAMAAEAADAGQIPRPALAAWRGAGLTSDTTPRTYLLRPGDRGQRAVRQHVLTAIDRLVAERDICLIFEELEAGRTEPTYPTAELAEAGFFHLRVASATHFTGTSRVGRRAVACDRDTPTTGERLVLVGSTVVATADADGAGAQLYVHPFLNSQGALTAATLVPRSQIFANILDALFMAVNANGTAGGTADESGGEDSVRQRELREAVVTLDILPGFVRALGARPQQQLQALQTQLDLKIGEVTRLRAQLMETIREKVTLEASREALERSASALSIEHLANALVQVNRIRTRLHAVRQVGLASGNGTPAISVTLQPLVLKHAGRCYLLDELSFTLPLDSATPSWNKALTERQSPHPHVSRTGSTCWGQAQVPIQQALERKDFVAAVMHIVGWASIYNGNSPHVRLERGCPFDICTLSPGWHPELPVRV